jgi:hypothetical protein
MHTILTRRLALTAALALALVALAPEIQAQTRAHALTTAGTAGIAEPVGLALATPPIAVTSRKVVWLLSEQLRFEFVPVLHGLQGRLAAEG